MTVTSYRNLCLPENTRHRGKDHCMAGLQFDWLGFNRFTTFKQQHIFLFGSNTACQFGFTSATSLQVLKRL